MASKPCIDPPRAAAAGGRRAAAGESRKCGLSSQDRDTCDGPARRGAACASARPRSSPGVSCEENTPARVAKLADAWDSRFPTPCSSLPFMRRCVALRPLRRLRRAALDATFASMQWSRVKRHARPRPSFRPLARPRCMRCLHHLEHPAKYCRSCRRKVIGIRLLCVVAAIVLLGLYLHLVRSSPTAAVWIQ